MAYLNATSTSPTFHFGRVTSVFSALVKRYQNYRLYRETIRSLSDLSTTDLTDLGISRSDIQRVAKNAVYH